MRIMFLLIFTLALATAGTAQGFPWNDFKPGTISDLIDKTVKAVRPDDTMFLATGLRESRVEVTFTGKSRATISPRQTFLYWWAGTLNFGQDYASLYKTEYLYTERQKDYWLPTEEPITKYFDKELKPGDKMVLFLIRAGAYRDGKDIDTVLLVEEYQLPQNLKNVIKSDQ